MRVRGEYIFESTQWLVIGTHWACFEQTARRQYATISEHVCTHVHLPGRCSSKHLYEVLVLCGKYPLVVCRGKIFREVDIYCREVQMQSHPQSEGVKRCKSESRKQ